MRVLKNCLLGGLRVRQEQKSCRAAERELISRENPVKV